MNGAGSPPPATGALDALLAGPVVVVNVGLAGFAEDLEAAGVPVVHVDWRPPAGGDERLAALLAALEDDGEPDPADGRPPSTPDASGAGTNDGEGAGAPS